MNWRRRDWSVGKYKFSAGLGEWIDGRDFFQISSASVHARDEVNAAGSRPQARELRIIQKNRRSIGE